MNELPRREDFLAQLNTKFRVYFEAERATEAALVDVSEVRRQPRYEAFGIVFLAPNDAPPVQILCKIQHDTLGEMELFLVPFARDEKGLSFEALFNQPIKADDG